MHSAVKDVVENQMILMSASKKHGVSKSALQRKVKKFKLANEEHEENTNDFEFGRSHGFKLIFTSAEEQLLSEYIIEACEMCYGLTLLNTHTPVKDAIEEQHKERLAKKALSEEKKQKAKKVKRQVFNDDISSNSDVSEEICNDSSDLESFTSEYQDLSIQEQDYVIVRYMTKKTVKHYVGQVIKISGDEYNISFMKRIVAGKFVFPDKPDEDTLVAEDILLKLPPPTISGKNNLDEQNRKQQHSLLPANNPNNRKQQVYKEPSTSKQHHQLILINQESQGITRNFEEKSVSIKSSRNHKKNLKNENESKSFTERKPVNNENPKIENIFLYKEEISLNLGNEDERNLKENKNNLIERPTKLESKILENNIETYKKMTANEESLTNNEQEERENENFKAKTDDLTKEIKSKQKVFDESLRNNKNNFKKLQETHEKKVNKAKEKADKFKEKIAREHSKNNELEVKIKKLKEELYYSNKSLKKKNHEIAELDKEVKQQNREIKFKQKFVDKTENANIYLKKQYEGKLNEVEIDAETMRKHLKEHLKAKYLKLRSIKNFESQISKLENAISNKLKQENHKQTENLSEQANGKMKKNSALNLDLQEYEKIFKELTQKVEKQIGYLQTQDMQKRELNALGKQNLTLERIEGHIDNICVSCSVVINEETSPLSPVSPAESIDDTKTDEHNEREVLKTFISVYRQNPILWNTSLKEYSDRDKKNKCYKQLVEIYQKIKKRATIEDVKKKINSLRTNYRKDLKKIKDSQRTGSSTDDIYEPTSWIFLELQFLNVEKLDNTRSTVPEKITNRQNFPENNLDEQNRKQQHSLLPANNPNNRKQQVYKEPSTSKQHHQLILINQESQGITRNFEEKSVSIKSSRNHKKNLKNENESKSFTERKPVNNENPKIENIFLYKEEISLNLGNEDERNLKENKNNLIERPTKLESKILENNIETYKKMTANEESLTNNEQEERENENFKAKTDDLTKEIKSKQKVFDESLRNNKNNFKKLQETHEKKVNKAKEKADKFKEKIAREHSKNNELEVKIKKLKEELYYSNKSLKKKNHEIAELDKEVKQQNREIKFKQKFVDKTENANIYLKKQYEGKLNEVEIDAETMRKHLKEHLKAKYLKLRSIKNFESQISKLENAISNKLKQENHKQTENLSEQANGKMKKNSALNLDLQEYEKIFKELTQKVEKQIGYLQTQDMQKRELNALGKQNLTLERIEVQKIGIPKDEKSSEKDEEHYIAQVWANKLKALEPNQKLFAEKAINDMLFEARLGTLQRDSVKINSSHYMSPIRAISAQSWTPSTSHSMGYSTVSTPLPSPQYQNLEDSGTQPQQTSEFTQNQSLQNFYNTFRI
ncbi:unnamed protein product [Ceutorhynchus assimilis]|uniref:MADF domain-containing protein n=1 Tax=Ceutorhynchus assimilis TaxID=467358 RepID=A0A9N9N208_9CUCU|nr:unnamed protein product [Ceutorhynchus assimilis]